MTSIYITNYGYVANIKLTNIAKSEPCLDHWAKLVLATACGKTENYWNLRCSPYQYWSFHTNTPNSAG